MDSVTDLREQVDAAIGVHTHSAAVLVPATGGVLDEVTVEATSQGYAELVTFADNHATLRAWAIEETSGHSAGVGRHLLASALSAHAPGCHPCARTSVPSGGWRVHLPWVGDACCRIGRDRARRGLLE